MKRSIVLVSTLTALLGSAAAHACPHGAELEIGPVVQPATSPSEIRVLLARAVSLEEAARDREERGARTRERASVLERRARLVRQQAASASARDRATLLAVADDLDVEAADARASATRDHTQATELRRQARQLRLRAEQLAAGGGGWRRVRDRRPPTVSSEQAI